MQTVKRAADNKRRYVPGKGAYRRFVLRVSKGGTLWHTILRSGKKADKKLWQGEAQMTIRFRSGQGVYENYTF